MKIVIVGGHLSPALAVIQALAKDADILFIGRKHALEGDQAYSLEYQKITSLDIPFFDITAGRLQRKFTRHTLNSFFKLPAGFFQALKLLHKFKPDVVVCFGGYVQIPVGFAAYLQGTPIIIHEQTMKAGLANKIIAPLSKTICISWPESAIYFPSGKTVLTGILIRKEFLEHKQGIKKNKHTTIYITGGSLGAHAINYLVKGCVKKLLEKFYIIHQTGDAKEYADFEHLKKIKENLPKDLQSKYTLVKFFDPKNVISAMASADLVVSRSGINTVAELMYLGKPCILIPLPHGQSNEQLENALYIQSLGLAKVIKQEEITPEILYSQIVEFTAKLDSVKGSVRQVRRLIKHDSAEKIVRIISQFGNKKK